MAQHRDLWRHSQYSGVEIEAALDMFTGKMNLVILPADDDNPRKPVMHVAMKRQGWVINELVFAATRFPFCCCGDAHEQGTCLHEIGFLMLKKAVDFPERLDPRPDGSRPKAKDKKKGGRPPNPPGGRGGRGGGGR